MIKYLKNKISLLDKHTIEVISKSAKSTVVKILGMIAGLFVSIFLGRTIGAEGLGIINLSNQIANFTIIILLLGLRQVVLKEIAIGYSNNSWKHIASVLQTSLIINGVLSILATVILIIITPWLANTVFKEPRLEIPLVVFFMALTPMVFSRQYSSALIGFKKIWQSNLADQTLSFGIIGIILFVMKVMQYEITIIGIAIIYAISRAAVLLIIWLYWKTLFNYRGEKEFIGKQIMKPAWSLLLVSIGSTATANLGIIILGIFKSSGDVGLFTIASKIALLTSFFLLITNSAISPKIAELYSKEKYKELEKLVQRVTKGLSIIALFSIIIIVFLGKGILGLWGNEFRAAYIVLIIISIGQFINISTGASGLLLIMTGFEKTQSYISIFSLMASIFLNILLISLYGIVGAAIATFVIISLENILKVVYSYKKTGISTVSIYSKYKKN